jgi:hypothetical protein
VGFVVAKLALGQVSPSTSDPFANSYSTDCSRLIIIIIIIIIRGLYKGPNSGRRTKWTASTHHKYEKKKLNNGRSY